MELPGAELLAEEEPSAEIAGISNSFAIANGLKVTVTCIEILSLAEVFLRLCLLRQIMKT